jgi:hypothetical protein
MMRSVLRGPATRSTASAPRAQAPRASGSTRSYQAVSHPVQQGGLAAPRPSNSTAIPPQIRGLVPTRAGEMFCMRFQTMKDCDFRDCRRWHELTPIPPAVVTWVENKHGSLKSDHPSFTV